MPVGPPCSNLNAPVHAAVQVQYLSPSWAEQALRLVETDPRIDRALQGLEISILTIILHPPKGCYGFLYAAFDGDGLKDYRVGFDFASVAKGLEEPTFTVSGEYPVFASIQRGELTERKALLTGRLHLTGGMVKALRHMRTLEAFTAVMGSIPCKT
jgi:SCP-2 sterol transfer family